ncbi:MarR family transcriptional regulator [Virgibacillus indicus]|uniref:MarR family transcriptional regulator n=1 Tax=Virgibacillus indicus TaxID=2024554 RepID=A0A265NAW2_9BACI|nr:MarR family transcriptional regulator [Virgibacillus indicus]OZU89180.1 MarR family transcriptional regulator [Virgibacillus indicus]
MRLAENKLLEKKQDTSLKLFVVLSKAYKAVVEQVEKDIQSRGLNTTDFAVLELLFHNGQQPLKKIGEKILLASGSVTYVIKKLEKKGYLVRRNSPDDRRVTYAIITEQGRALLNNIFPGHWDQIKEIMSGLDEEEKKTSIELLKKLGTNIREM